MNGRSGRSLLAIATLGALTLVGCASNGSSATGPAPSGTQGAQASLGEKLPQEIRDKGVLTIATDAQYPPCEYMEGDKMVGFEPDLWNAMGEKLGIDIKVVNTAFDGLIPGVAAGRYDVAIECIDDTIEREKQVSFVNYAYSVDGVMFPAANPNNITEDSLTLCGLKAAVPRGTIWVTLVNEKWTPHCTENGKPPIKVMEFPSSSAALLAVYSGRADLQVVNLASARYLAKTAPQPVTVIANDKSAKYYSGIVIAKENTQLQDAMLAALQAIMADGQYTKIMKDWDLTEMSIEEPGINLASSNPLPVP